jgi:nicotinamide phosphoribosyltransferase
MTDSYKASHYLQYPPDTEYVSSYIESRGGKWSHVLFFGLQMFIKEYLTKPITQEMIEEAAEFWAAHGEPFNREGWEHILHTHKGFLPLEIKAVPEGTIVPVSNVLVQVVNTDPKCFWLTSFIETALLRAVWYPSTVATNSYACKRLIYKALEKSSDDPDGQIGFKLHDFGARGASSHETAAIGGAAHLVNFLGTDTVEGVMYVRKYYGETMAGFSIPAAEHSTMTTWGGRKGEVDAMRNMLTQFAKPGALVAVVSDSYDIWNAVNHLWGEELKEEVLASGACVVVRPDSGDPENVPVEVVKHLWDAYGGTTNEKGYKVLHPAVRVIQGDGIDVDTIKIILKNLLDAGFSADNIAFGQGGGLLQKVDRDTLMFAMKTSAIKRKGQEWEDVFKEPVDQPTKISKKGRLALIRERGFYDETLKTVRFDDIAMRTDVLRVVYGNERIHSMQEWTFAGIRERANRRIDV